MGSHKTNFNRSAFCTCHEFFSPGYRKDITKNKSFVDKKTIKRKLQTVFYLVSCQKKRQFISKPPQREVRDMFKVTCSVARVRGYNPS